MDWDFLGNPEAFEKRNRMDGPIRYSDGSVEVIQFYGRIALDNAEIRLPYHARRSPLRLRIRCRRFGLGGSVELTVNGVLLEEFVFGETPGGDSRLGPLYESGQIRTLPKKATCFIARRSICYPSIAR